MKYKLIKKKKNGSNSNDIKVERISRRILQLQLTSGLQTERIT